MGFTYRNFELTGQVLKWGHSAHKITNVAVCGGDVGVLEEEVVLTLSRIIGVCLCREYGDPERTFTVFADRPFETIHLRAETKDSALIWMNEISKAVGMDSRIGKDFLKPSVGFGGSCFQKDILNLVYIARSYGLDEVADYWHQVIRINDYQKQRFATSIIKLIGDKKNNPKVSVLGWAFKQNTNDSRESASIYVTDILLKNKISVNVYDPLVPRDKIISDLIQLWLLQKLPKDKVDSLLKMIKVKDNYIDAIKDSSLAAILTEWEEFKTYDWRDLIKKMKNSSIVYDGRNILPLQDKSINLIKLGVK